MNTRIWKLVAVLAALTFVAAACGDDDDTTTDVTEAPTDETAAPEGTEAPVDDTTTTAEAAGGDTGGDTQLTLDANGDGQVVFGVAAAGPRDDGAYYEAVVSAVTEASAENGFAEPIIADEIEAADAATAIGDLAQQGVDVMIIGASEIAEPLPQLIAEYPDIFWYCNCGAGFPPNDGLAQSVDDGSEINYSAGVATGLLLQDSGGDSVSFIGCCDLGFEKESYMAFELGLQSVDPSFTMTYVQTGDFPFDFDNTANATEALNQAIADGADAVYPFLGGAHRPIVELAEEAGLITMSAGSSTVCDDGEELAYDIAVRFDGGDYFRALLPEILSGELTEGTIRAFKVGVDPEPGAIICDATADQQTALDDVYAAIAAGDFAADFGAIKGEAYAGG